MAYRKKQRYRNGTASQGDGNPPSLQEEEQSSLGERQRGRGDSGGKGISAEENSVTTPSIGSDKYSKPLSMIALGTTQMELSGVVDYSAKLPRKRRKFQGCLGLSFFTWLFLVLAFLQAALVIGFQVAIAVLGEFRGERLDDYVRCFEDSIGYSGSGSIPSNITFPAFGKDKEIYIYFFIALVIYNFCLCFYALKFQNIIEVYMFLVINLLAIAYGGVQVYQFRGFGDACDAVTMVGYLALANALMVTVFSIVFGVLSFFIYLEFGWKIYTRVGFNSELRYYYRVYELFMSVLKILLLFLLVFFVGQCVLLLFVNVNNINYEFWIVVFIFVPLTFATYPFAYWTVRRENLIGSIALLVTDVLVIAYLIYKIFRYASRSCPLCKEQVDNIEEEVRALEDALSSNGSSQVRDIVDRIEQFEHLVLLGVVNLVIAIVALFVFIHLWRQYGKGLKEHFASSSSSFPCCKTSDSYTVQPESKQNKFLGLQKSRWNSNVPRRGKKKASESDRDSNLVETLTRQEPMFGEAVPTNIQVAQRMETAMLDMAGGEEDFVSRDRRTN